jgi:ubiquinone/menaquinone biosynthesis C-methylase UbiE
MSTITITSMSPDTTTEQPPSPVLFFHTLTAYQKSFAVKAALDLGVFTAIGDTPATAGEIASRCNAAERGMRILCDYLTINGFLEKEGDRYSLTRDTAIFLNQNSPAYAGTAASFLLSPTLTSAFDDLTSAVRKGGNAQSVEGTMAPEHPVWIEFARGMAPMMMPLAQALADLIPLDQSRDSKVLDVSASHGVFGITMAQKNPRAKVVAVDWAPVLAVARQNAQAAGLGERFSTIAGSAFEIDFGGDYDAVLVPNFLHHFDFPTCVTFLRKTHAALRDGGRVGIVEFVPADDRISPPDAAAFSLVMLATTAAGDAYTFAEFQEMLQQAGFREVEQHPLPPGVNTAVIAVK